MPPETRYAKSGDLNIAYQVVGDGPFDLVYVPGWVSNIDLAWEKSKAGAVPRAPGLLLPADPVRQARDRNVGPGLERPAADTRTAHGRRARSPRCGRVGESRTARTLGRQQHVRPLRRHV